MAAHELRKSEQLLRGLLCPEGGGVGADELHFVDDSDVVGLPGDFQGDLARAGVELFFDQDDGGAGDFFAGGDGDDLFSTGEFEALGGFEDFDFEGRGLVALVEHAQLVIISHRSVVEIEGHAGHAGDSDGVGLGFGEDGEGKNDQSDEAKEGVDENAWAKEAPLFAGEAVGRLSLVMMSSQASTQAAQPMHSI